MKRGKKISSNDELVRGQQYYVTITTQHPVDRFEVLMAAISSPMPDENHEVLYTTRLKSSCDPMHYNVRDFEAVYEAIP